MNKITRLPNMCKEKIDKKEDETQHANELEKLRIVEMKISA
jgi:hypothetical protein